MFDYYVLIVGVGFFGIGVVIKFDWVGFSDYFVVEVGDGVGGIWYWNIYFGIVVDILFFFY